MRPRIFVHNFSQEEQKSLSAGLRSSDAFVLRRSQILLACARGDAVPRIAQSLSCDEQTGRHAIHAFNQQGLIALQAGSSRPHHLPTVLREDVTAEMFKTDFTSMMKKTFLKMPLVGCLCFLLLLAACESKGQAPLTGTPPGVQTETTAPPTATSTVSQASFAATVGSSGNPVNRNAQGDNLTTIHSAVDRPVANFTQTILKGATGAKGVVFIQNDSANDQTLVSDTINGFAPFMIAHDTSTSLVFHRSGTFKAHLKNYRPDEPLSGNITLTIIISTPSPA